MIKRFEPWMALTFSEGSIGGDIERVNLTQLEAFYGKTPQPDGVARASTPIVRRADGIERHRHRAVEHRVEACAAADQPAHLVLLPRRSADGERAKG